MEKNKTFDYIIIGGGLAGLQLALAFSNDIYFEDKSIAIIEPSDKTENDKTWSFWEKGEGKWDQIIQHKWAKGTFRTAKKELSLQLKNYRYKIIRSENFYAYAKEKLELSTNIVWIKDKILSVEEQVCKGERDSFEATIIFDSRISPNFFEDKKHIHIHQHFKGWVIKTENNFFDPSQFVMMDYSLGYKNHCCFTYVLPTSSTTALVEFTFFTPELVKETVYDELLKEYISQQLQLEKYTIEETEFGIIPMSSYPFASENRDGYLKIGTGGGWVKSSSGYSFKNTERKVSQVIENIKNDSSLDNQLFSKKHAFYDRIFLRVLEQENHLGNQLFESMYSKNKAAAIFKFLDEETSLLEEIRIINSFEKAPFLRSLKKDF